MDQLPIEIKAKIIELYPGNLKKLMLLNPEWYELCKYINEKLIININKNMNKKILPTMILNEIWYYDLLKDVLNFIKNRYPKEFYLKFHRINISNCKVKYKQTESIRTFSPDNISYLIYSKDFCIPQFLKILKYILPIEQDDGYTLILDVGFYSSDIVYTYIENVSNPDKYKPFLHKNFIKVWNHFYPKFIL